MAPTADTLPPTFAERFLDESFEEAAAMLSPAGRTAVVESFPEGFADDEMDATDALEAYWWGLYGQYGPPDGVGETSVDGAVATVTLTFDEGTESATIPTDEDGVAGFAFDPEYRRPAYVDPEAFEERDVTVDAGDVDLGGVLTVPNGDGPFPGLLLVHGAGVYDPDGGDGASRLLRDFAQGLASASVATLRYESRLLDHEVPDADRTLDRVVTDDAVAALAELAAAPEVRADAPFVAGHSQGGTAAPRIAARHGDAAGVVVLDGRADPVFGPDDVDIVRYEFDPEGDLDEEQRARLDADRETARRLAAGDYEDDETIWGQPGTWHRSVAEYDPVATARAFGRPTFVGKTCRADEDAQPELAAWLRSEFEAWRDADLPEGSRVECYEGLDHFFQSGYAPTWPTSLYFGGNVAEDVVADLSEWVHGVADE
ncbi:alpha/beta hydrolase family protein [Halomarina oriensis]|uniref:Alpha/beta hydrolase n=1 Tax=Halomarina oriensis TaxID=671145 RepID=A0A6B0GTU1_9EURY|nr:alpha/beta fold hydrolase [Halomarina oriensis]MWG36033.1 alpha/beta hydrolase [Halomarina oriensis]